MSILFYTKYKQSNTLLKEIEAKLRNFYIEQLKAQLKQARAYLRSPACNFDYYRKKIDNALAKYYEYSAKVSDAIKAKDLNAWNAAEKKEKYYWNRYESLNDEFQKTDIQSQIENAYVTESKIKFLEHAIKISGSQDFLLQYPRPLESEQQMIHFLELKGYTVFKSD